MDEGEGYDEIFSRFDSNMHANNNFLDNRSAGLAPLDNRTLAGGDNGEFIDPTLQRRSGRRRRPRQSFETDIGDGGNAVDDDELDARPARRRRRPNEAVSWNYANMNELVYQDDDIYDTSCDELEFPRDQPEEVDETPLSRRLNANNPSSPGGEPGDSGDEGGEEGESRPDSSPRANSGNPLSQADNDEEDILNMPESNRIPRATEQRQRFTDKSCFGCMWKSARQENTAISVNRMNKCIAMIEQNYGTIDNRYLAKLVHKYFKHKIYLPKEGKVPMWRTRTIQDHIEKHTLEPRIFVGESIRNLKKFMAAIGNMTFTEQVNEAGETHTIPQKDNIKLYLDIHKRIAEMYKINPKEMNFFRPDCAINYDTIGSLINLQKIFTITEEEL